LVRTDFRFMNQQITAITKALQHLGQAIAELGQR
jgi:hypothetical protein